MKPHRKAHSQDIEDDIRAAEVALQAFKDGVDVAEYEDFAGQCGGGYGQMLIDEDDEN